MAGRGTQPPAIAETLDRSPSPLPEPTMDLTTALDEFELLERRRHRGEDAQLRALALAALREYLVDYAGLETTENVSPDDLFTFLLEYYPTQEEPDALAALALLQSCAGFAVWLME